MTNDVKVPAIKSINSLRFKKRAGRQHAGGPKKFALNEFLDQYLDSQQNEKEQKKQDDENMVQQQ